MLKRNLSDPFLQSELQQVKPELKARRIRLRGLVNSEVMHDLQELAATVVNRHAAILPMTGEQEVAYRTFSIVRDAINEFFDEINTSVASATEDV